MTVKISVAGSGISVLCMEKETLQSKAAILNSDMELLIMKFQQDMRKISDQQRYNIMLIGKVDDAIEKLIKEL